MESNEISDYKAGRGGKQRQMQKIKCLNLNSKFWMIQSLCWGNSLARLGGPASPKYDSA